MHIERAWDTHTHTQYYVGVCGGYSVWRKQRVAWRLDSRLRLAVGRYDDAE